MVESRFDSNQEEEIVCNHSEVKVPALRREPSFSRWCNEDGISTFEHQLEASDESVQDTEFELPLLHQGRIGSEVVDTGRHQYSGQLQNGSLHLSITNSMDQENNIHNRGNEKGKFQPFDIEDASTGAVHAVDNGAHGNGSVGSHEMASPKYNNPISAADVLKTLFFIFVWYTFSTFLTLYNKTLLGDDMGKFPAPLLMNTVHFGMQAALSNAITGYWSNRFQPPISMSWRDYFLRVVPTALGTALDINLSNASLVFISVTFATMCKSASPIFLLLFAFAFKLEAPSVKLLGIILVISIGILLTVAKETEFEFWGFVFVMLAAVMSGFRWSMTQILLQKESYGLKNPLTLMSYVTPVMALATALLSLVLDPWSEFDKTNYFDNSWHIARSCLLMLFGGSLAFFMVLTEYILISVTSAVTVTIAGVVKEAVTILVAVFYFHDEFTWLKGAGLFVIMIGVSLFNWYKYLKLQKGQANEDGSMGSPITSVAAKYVILEEEMDDEDTASGDLLQT